MNQSTQSDPSPSKPYSRFPAQQRPEDPGTIPEKQPSLISDASGHTGGFVIGSNATNSGVWVDETAGEIRNNQPACGEPLTGGEPHIPRRLTERNCADQQLTGDKSYHYPPRRVVLRKATPKPPQANEQSSKIPTVAITPGEGTAEQPLFMPPGSLPPIQPGTPALAERSGKKTMVALMVAIALVLTCTVTLTAAWALGGSNNRLFQAIGLASGDSTGNAKVAGQTQTKDGKNPKTKNGQKNGEKDIAAAQWSQADKDASLSAQAARQEALAKAKQHTDQILRGHKIMLDPGHNGGNGRTQIRQQVPNGRGSLKSCNTDGAATNAGYPEHRFNWEVANLLKAKLEKAGAQVFMTRQNDTGVGPCVDVRGQMPTQVGAELLLSIHANGSDSSGPHGFFMMVSNPPLNQAQGEPSRKLATSLSQGLKTQGLVPSSIFGDRPMNRSDLATLNHSKVPAVMAELAEMRNATDAARIMSVQGREQYAEGLYQGLILYFSK